MTNFRLTKAALSSVLFGLALLLVLTLAMGRCGRGASQPPVVIVDTVVADTVRKAKKDSMPSKNRKKKGTKKKASKKASRPVSRPYRDQPVDNPLGPM